MKNNDLLISVIIPVYNVEKYLDRCVESIVNQTYKNLEIILIDDGSPDNCPKMCDEWAKKDKRIKVIHKENGGVSSARNVGLNIANGDYLSFIDSDDYIEPDMYWILNKIHMKNKKDIYIFNYNIIEGDRTKKGNITKEPINLFQLELFEKNGIDGYLWNKIYSKEILKDIKFDTEISMCEDLLFNLKISEKNVKYAYLNESLYNYVKNKNSVLNLKYNSDISRMKVVEYIAEYMEKYSKHISIKAKVEYIIDYENIYLYNKKYNKNKINKKEYLTKSRKYVKYGLLKEKINLNLKIKIVLILYFTFLYESVHFKKI